MLRGPGLAVHPQPRRGDRKDRGAGNVGSSTWYDGRTPSGARLNCRAGGHRSPPAVSRGGHIPNEAGGTA